MTAARKLNRKNILAKYKDLVDVHILHALRLTNRMSMPKRPNGS
jgi:hypothetical protein